MSWTIYCHVHTESGRRYVGLTKHTMMHRWNQHCAQSKTSKDGRWHFPNAVRKYGKDAFSHEVLEICHDLDVANLAEECWIELLETRNPEKGFNLAKGGAHGEWSDTKTTREKLSEATKKSMTPDRRAYLSSIRAGQIATQGTRDKLRESALRNSEKIASSNRARGRDYFVQINRIGQQKRIRKTRSSYKNCHIHGLLTLGECYLFTTSTGYVKRFCKKCSIRKRTDRKREVRRKSSS